VFAKKEKNSPRLKIARVVLFIFMITIVLLLFYLSTINIISSDTYLISGFGTLIASAIINYAIVRVYGNKRHKEII